jgi:TonB-linked SusC/RagA family outer membrane protein
MNNEKLRLIKKCGRVILLLLTFSFNVAAQDITVRGTVIDESGEPAVGATIQVRGTEQGTIADFDGNFTLSVPAGSVLQISFVGFQTQEVAAAANMRIVLQADVGLLDELVVIGFGTQARGNLTGAVSVVNMDNVLGDRPITNIGHALQGAVPGLRITGGASPGAASNFNIRGQTHLGGAGSPLILVDNVEISDLNLINPEDIESISVLKDAASAAIFGARASRGVILITTRRAARNSRMTINYNNNFAFDRVTNQLQPAGVRDHVAAFNEWAPGGNWFADSQPYALWLSFIDEYQANPTAFAARVAQSGGFFCSRWGMYVPAGEGSGRFFYLRDNNSQNEIFDRFGFRQTHNLSASGGGETITYRMSLGYISHDGPLMTNKDKFERITVSAFVSADITPWLNQSIDIRYARTNRSEMETNWNSGIFNLRYFNFQPGADRWPAANNLEGPTWLTNAPLNFLLYGDPRLTRNESPRIFSRTTITPFSGFEAVLEYTYDARFHEASNFPNRLDMRNPQMMQIANENPVFRRDRDARRMNSLNLFGTYTFSLADMHNFRVMAGFSQEERTIESMWADRREMIDTNRPSLTGAQGDIFAGDGFGVFATRSGFFRFNYNFKNRYLLEINARYDGSSRFPTDTRFGFFPSVSAGWQVAREDWMSWASGWLNGFMIRGSYGQLGNQEIADFAFLPQMTVIPRSRWIFDGGRPTSLNPPGIVRSNFGWERVSVLDIGTELNMFNNRFQSSFSWFQRDTRDMLGPALELPAVLGAGAPQQNSADLRTRGFDLEVSWRDRIGDWGYSIAFNLHDSRSHVTRFANEQGLLGTFREGQEFGEIWGHVFERFYTIDDFEDTWRDGVWTLREGVTSILGHSPRPGDIMFRNLRDDENSVNRIDNGDNTLDNPGDRKVIGNSTPRFHFGTRASVSYRGFDLSVFIQGVARRDVMLPAELVFPLVGTNPANDNTGTIFRHQLGNWVQVDENFNILNPNAFLPRIYGQPTTNSSNRRVSDRFLADGSYLRIRNITLSYTFPRQWIQPLTLTNARVFFSTENPFTFSRLPSGVDPDRISWGYPFFVTNSFGLSITM